MPTERICAGDSLSGYLLLGSVEVELIISWLGQNCKTALLFNEVEALPDTRTVHDSKNNNWPDGSGNTRAFHVLPLDCIQSSHSESSLSRAPATRIN